MKKPLVMYAGTTAIQSIRVNGLRQEDVKVLAGAAGGPKWLVLNHLDRLIFSTWLAGRRKPLHLLGSSIGSWRFAAASQEQPLEAMERFEEAYIHQAYHNKPTPSEVSNVISRILDDYLDLQGIRQLLNHPFLRIHIMAVHCQHVMAKDQKIILGAGLAGAALANGFHRNWMKHFFHRALFYHPVTPPPFLEMEGFPIQKIALTESNMRSALLASGSIPLIMSGVTGIPGARAGVYRDGGILDYHFDVDFLGKERGLVLFPHYTDRIIPGWLDKKLPFRKPSPKNMEKVLLISPSREWVGRLPYGKIPDRNDFFLFKGRDNARIAYWKSVVNESRRLADFFWNAVDSGRIRELVEPLPL